MVTPTPRLKFRLEAIEYFRPSLINKPKLKLLLLQSLDTSGLPISDIRWTVIEGTKLMHRLWGTLSV